MTPGVAVAITTAVRPVIAVAVRPAAAVYAVFQAPQRPPPRFPPLPEPPAPPPPHPSHHHHQRLPPIPPHRSSSPMHIPPKKRQDQQRRQRAVSPPKDIKHISLASFVGYNKVSYHIANAINSKICEIAYDTVGIVTGRDTVYAQARLASDPRSIEEAIEIESAIRLNAYSVSHKIPMRPIMFWRTSKSSGGGGGVRRETAAEAARFRAHVCGH